MDTLMSVFYIVLGFLFRLAIPIVGTVLLVLVLRKLDARWQAEAESKPLPGDKPECWKVKGCTAEQIDNCAAATSPLPCWQAYRSPNGYLNEECLSCEVFIKAPVPMLKTEPRRL